MNRLYETMTRVVVGAFIVRVWRCAACLSVGPDIEVKQALTEIPMQDVATIAGVLDGFTGIEAYEILDGDGNGALVYPDWK